MGREMWLSSTEAKKESTRKKFSIEWVNRPHPYRKGEEKATGQEEEEGDRSKSLDPELLQNQSRTGLPLFLRNPAILREERGKKVSFGLKEGKPSWSTNEIGRWMWKADHRRGRKNWLEKRGWREEEDAADNGSFSSGLSNSQLYLNCQERRWLWKCWPWL